MADDLQRVQACLAGDRGSEAWVLGCIDSAAKAVCRLYRVEASRRDDVLQEIRIQALRGLSHFQGKALFSSWAFRVAINVTLQANKKTSREKHHRVAWELATGRVDGEYAEEVDYFPLLEELLGILPPLQRSAFILCALQGNTYEYAGDVLSVSEVVLKGRVHRARERAREFLPSRGLSPKSAPIAEEG